MASRNLSEIEKEEIARRVGAMTIEEQQIVVRMIPTEILIEEIRMRDAVNRSIINGINQTMAAAMNGELL